MKDSLPEGAEALAAAANEQEYQQRLIDLLREQSAVDIGAVTLPAAPGWRGRLLGPLRRFWWRLLRHQHEQVTLQHNAVHELQAAALAYEHELTARRLADLEQRLAKLEQGRTDAGPRTS
jgi:hypothetical protein